MKTGDRRSTLRKGRVTRWICRPSVCGKLSMSIRNWTNPAFGLGKLGTEASFPNFGSPKFGNDASVPNFPKPKAGFVQFRIDIDNLPQTDGRQIHRVTLPFLNVDRLSPVFITS